MPTPFGPQLIGETEKALGALLRKFLEGSGLTESQWVTLRLADVLDGVVDARGLAEAVTSRAQFVNAADLVSGLSRRDLLADGRLTSAGRSLIATVQATITTETFPIWDRLPDDEIAAASRLLNEVVTRARAVLGRLPSTPVPPTLEGTDRAPGAGQSSRARGVDRQDLQGLQRLGLSGPRR